MSKIAGELNAEMMKNNKVIHAQRAQLFQEMVGKTGSQQSVLDRLLVEIEQLRAENSALKAELAEAKKDADRLDWLQVHDKRFYNIDKIAAIVGSGFSCSGYKTRHTDIRNAIDAAMKGK